MLRDVTLGRLWNQQESQPLTPMTAVIGKNGVGKSVLFDAFGFLSDAMKLGVEEACDTRGRGGFEKMRTQGETGPIEFEVYYRERANARPITYEVAIEADQLGRPQVREERLRQRRRNQRYGRPFSFLWLNDGRGVAWKEEEGHHEKDFEALLDEALEQEDIKAKKSKLIALMELAQREEPNETEAIELEDRRKLGIATLGALAQHPRISAFRRFIEGWYLSYFTPDAARSLPLAGPQSRLNVHGDNIGNVVQFMEREYPQRFRAVLDRIAEKIPGIDRIDTERTSDDRLLLRFNDKEISGSLLCPAGVRWNAEGICLPVAASKIPSPRRSSASRSRRTASITSSWRPLPTNSGNIRPEARARRSSLRHTSRISWMHSPRRRSGSWRRVRMVIRRFDEPATILL